MNTNKTMVTMMSIGKKDKIPTNIKWFMGCWIIGVLLFMSFNILSKAEARDENKDGGYTKAALKIENLLVAKRDAGSGITSNGSMVKITDGCRVIHIMNVYYTVSGKLKTCDSFCPTQMVVSDAGCEK